MRPHDITARLNIIPICGEFFEDNVNNLVILLNLKYNQNA